MEYEVVVSLLKLSARLIGNLMMETTHYITAEMTVISLTVQVCVSVARGSVFVTVSVIVEFWVPMLVMVTVLVTVEFWVSMLVMVTFCVSVLVTVTLRMSVTVTLSL